MSAADELRKLDRHIRFASIDAHVMVLNGLPIYRALPEIIAVVEAAEKARPLVDDDLGSPGFVLEDALAALTAKLETK